MHGRKYGLCIYTRTHSVYHTFHVGFPDTCACYRHGYMPGCLPWVPHHRSIAHLCPERHLLPLHVLHHGHVHGDRCPLCYALPAIRDAQPQHQGKGEHGHQQDQVKGRGGEGGGVVTLRGRRHCLKEINKMYYNCF